MKDHSPYIEILEVGKSPSGKTSIWEVRNKNTQEYLGRIKWHGAWRKYVFESPPSELFWIYDSQCLTQIAQFLEKSNRWHKTLRSVAKGESHLIEGITVKAGHK